VKIPCTVEQSVFTVKKIFLNVGVFIKYKEFSDIGFNVCDATSKNCVMTIYLLTYLLAYLFTYLLTPWCRVLLEKLTGFQPIKKFSAFYGTRRFITALTSAHHLSLS